MVPESSSFAVLSTSYGVLTEYSHSVRILNCMLSSNACEDSRKVELQLLVRRPSGRRGVQYLNRLLIIRLHTQISHEYMFSIRHNMCFYYAYTFKHLEDRIGKIS
ncbi:hypothetical protein KC19_VG127800 [Ceratodon purpureus]|uniref:Uncharacterized protein n=1 Tax=Ceratodon purpureus TaxID=3225 RepID=A0A8T0HPQ8_CERPU|nr:hypothetical protein KC19_VG127800 [Ceratodon purpureus]